MKRLVLGFGLVFAAVYLFGDFLRDFFASPQPQPSWEETDNDPEDLAGDLAQRARAAEGAQVAAETDAAG